MIALVRRHPALAALAAGAATPFAFSPFDLFFLAPPALAVLFLAWQGRPERRWQAAFAYGIGLFGVGVSWVYISLATFGNMPLALALVCVAGFIAILAGFPVLAALATRLVGGASEVVSLLLVFPACWVAAEVARNHLLTGFSWLESGYSQVGTPLANLATMSGVHGVSLVTAVLAGLLACAASGAGGRRLAWLALLPLPYLAGHLAGRVAWTVEDGPPVRAALVQGNVPLATKWNLAAANRVAQRYLDLSRDIEEVDLIVWPESPLPFFIDQMGARFYDEVVALSAPLLSGFLERRPRPDGFDYYNSAVYFGLPAQTYRKQHLVPFGEYTPLAALFEPLVAFFDVPMSVLSPWRGEQAPMTIAGRAAAVSICYEDAFPADIRPLARQAQFLVNITEDAWFGDSLASAQRLQMARMRSIETARPMFRASNTGLATLIDHRGVVQAVSPRNVEYVLTGALQPRDGETPYLRFGDGPLLLALVLMVLAGAVAGRRRRRQRDD